MTRRRRTTEPRILLIRLREIGDVVFTTPLIRAVRDRLPAAYLGFLVETAAAPVVARNPCLNEVLVAPRSQGTARLREDFALASRLRSQHWDTVVDLQSGTRSAWLTRATRAAVRIGYDSPGRNWAYTLRVPRPARGTQHSVENQWPLIAPLDGESWTTDRRRRPTEMPLDPEATARTAARLAQAGVGPRERLILIHVSAGNRFRRWGEWRFAELAARLAAAAPERRIVITSGPSDVEAAARVRSMALLRLDPESRARIPAISELSLSELRAALESAALFIGGDSGPLHIASTSTAPIVGIFGPTTAQRSSPWRDPSLPFASVDAGPLPCRPCDQRRCVPGDFRCLTGLSVAAVLAASERVLSTPTVPGTNAGGIAPTGNPAADRTVLRNETPRVNL
jgi:predicted lipopolysaccharide heptosyltransferase III